MFELSECSEYVSTDKRNIALYLCLSIISIVLYILHTQRLNQYDLYLSLSGLFVCSSIALLMVYPNCSLLSLFHILIVVVLFFSIWVENKYLLCAFLYILLSFHILWYIYGKCIIFKEGESWGLEMPQYITAYIWTAILGYKLFTLC